MQAKTKTAPTFLRTSYTETITFTGGKPDAATRKALREAGFRWNRVAWWRNVNSTNVIKAKELAQLLTPAPVVEQPAGEPEAN